jgi:hypothetical protein
VGVKISCQSHTPGPRSKLLDVATLQASDFSGKALLTVQVGGNASREKTTRCYGERATKIDHASEGAAMEDVEAVLLRDSE